MSVRLRTLRWVAVPFPPSRARVKTSPPRRVHTARSSGLVRKTFSTTARAASLRDISEDRRQNGPGRKGTPPLTAVRPSEVPGLALADLLMDQALIVPSVHRVLISCSWVRPTRSACLGFKDRNAALRVCRWFNVGGPYVVAGCKVQAEAPVRERDPKKPWAWTVVLTGVPVKASKRDIGATIPKASKPSHIKLGDTNYDIEPAEAAAAVKTMLSQVGRVEQWKTRARNDKTLKVMVWFAHEVYAEKAMFALHRVPLPFWPEGHLSLMPLTEVKYKVSTPIYMAVKAELVTLQKDFRRRDVFLSILDDADSSQHRYLTLVSARIGALVDSKALLERVLFDELVEQEARGPSMGIPKELLAHAQRRRERPTTEPARGTIGW